ncbi:MAG: hypothetical protein FWE46_03355 [Coriobacteriia bacterium]|nr:hypothetical protein [Coriobacteriia bacterium]MCL2537344.1 hypothetical protein [Coriobacteriia bacterium]
MTAHNKTSTIALVAIIFPVIILLLGITAYFSYLFASDVYASQKMMRLSLSNQSAEALASAVDEMKLFLINGIISSTDWIEVHEHHLTSRGYIYITEYVVEGIDGRPNTLLLVLVPESVAGVTIFHLLPLVMTGGTVLLAEPRANERVAELKSHDVNLCPQGSSDLAQVDFSLHDGWIHADRIFGQVCTANPNSLAYDLVLTANVYETYGFSRHPRMSDKWLIAQPDKASKIRGIGAGGYERISPYVTPRTGTVELGEYYGVAQLLVPTMLGQARIFHLVQIYFLDRNDVLHYGLEEFENPGAKSTISAILSNGKLQYTRD